MRTLTDLPSEILHGILSHVEPWDLYAIHRVCRYLNGYLKANKALCRDIYYRTLDEPPTKDIDWEKELKDFVLLRSICYQGTRIIKRGFENYAADFKKELPVTFRTVTRLLETASGGSKRASRSITYPTSRNVTFLADWLTRAGNDTVFSRSFIIERALWAARDSHDPPKEEHQMSAKLYSLANQHDSRWESSRIYPFACSKVYDLREYTEDTAWGPFMSDGSMRVDWEKIQALLVVLAHNIEYQGLNSSPVFSNIWSQPFPGTWPNSYVPWPGTEGGLTDLEKRDPYNVSGAWVRVVCFLDYNDFFAFNFPPHDPLPANVPRPALSCGEATRVILMRTHVTEIEPPGPEDGQELPVVHFKGTSRSLHGPVGDNGNSDLRGTVRLTPEGEERWTSYSVFNGEERWKSEGIQLGGRRSARGVVGNWFEKDMDPHGPVGPTSFWKIADRGVTSDEQKSLITDLLNSLHGHVIHMDDDNGEDDEILGGDEFEDPDDDDDYEEDEIDDDELEGIGSYTPLSVLHAFELIGDDEAAQQQE